MFGRGLDERIISRLNGPEPPELTDSNEAMERAEAHTQLFGGGNVQKLTRDIAASRRVCAQVGTLTYCPFGVMWTEYESKCRSKQLGRLPQVSRCLIERDMACVRSHASTRAIESVENGFK